MDSKIIPPRQYYISKKSQDHVPEGYTHKKIEEWNLVVDSSFQLHPIYHGEDRVGLVFGTWIDTRTENQDQDHQLDTEATQSVRAGCEQALNDLAGRYVCLINTSEGVSLYLDPAGSLPAVYDVNREVVSASPAAMVNIDHRERFRPDLFEAVTWPLISEGENSWIPGTLTYYRDIARLLPNHYLDLQSWEQIRHWPGNDISTHSVDPAVVVEKILSELQSFFDKLVSTYRQPAISLTAGKDSRLLLAAAKSKAVNHDISFFTFGTDDANVDVHIARQLANATGVDWATLPIRRATEIQQTEWLERTGHTVSSAIKIIHPTLQHLDSDVQVGGLGGEIGRGYYWQDSRNPNTDIGPSELLLCFNKPELPELHETISEWCLGAEQFNTYTTLDLAYQEHRLGCWGGPQHLGLPPEKDYLRPLWHRPIIALMHRLPPKTRYRDELVNRVIEQAWPELGVYPYNSFINWRQYQSKITGTTAKVKTALEHPAIALNILYRDIFE